MRGQFWIVSHIVTKELKKVFAKYITGRLIDIGCGEKPFESLLQKYVSEHVGVDHEETMHHKGKIDIFAPAYNIPVENETFDCTLCTAVLEHLEEPDKAIAECSRILKMDGIAIYAAPFIWNLHEEPRDFFRFSKYGLTYLFEKNGFQILELKALSGFWVTFAAALTVYLWKFRRKKGWVTVFKPLFMLLPPFVLLIQAVAYLLDRLDTREEWTWAYVVVAKKQPMKKVINEC
jgi:SAM-dependent methyltransferase